MKLKLVATVLLLILNSGLAEAQVNLITNGSFENYTGSCPVSSPNGALSQVTDWSPPNSMPVHGVPHAELYCGGTPNYGGCMPGPPGASDGDAYVGFHTRNISSPYNEAIYQELTVPLTSANSYRISFDLITCQSGIFTSGPSDFCVYANSDTIIPGCPTQNPAVVELGCVPFDSISVTGWKHHEIDFVAPANTNVIAFSGGACFTTDVYYYFDNVVLTSTTSLEQPVSADRINFSVKPNPFIDFITVEIFEKGNFTFEMLDITGKSITTLQLNGNSIMNYPVSENLSAGIYFVKISGSNTFVTSKLVKLN
jgi:Secretion system C-terminal sorting domain